MTTSTTTPASDTAPRTFTDGAGREWVVRVRVSDVRTVLLATGFDLKRVAANAAHAVALLDDRFRFGATLYALCHEQAVARGVEPEEFARALVPAAIGAAVALLMALADWCGGGGGAAALRAIARDLEREGADLAARDAAGTN